jgi:hypothetical protein
MTVNERTDELGIAYLLALDELRAAETGLLRAVTATQEESAATWLRRVAAHVRYCKEELLAHCARHGCPVPVAGLEQGRIVRRDACAAASWAGAMAA